MASIKDNFRLQNLGGIRMPKFKGHVKIILKDKKTGATSIEEGDNIITDAVPDIFARNILGGISYSNLMPFWQKWLGGILCYEAPFATSGSPAEPDPTDYFPQGDDINAVIAHAGPTPPTASDMQEDRKRGTMVDYIIQDGRVKQIFEWGTLAGNGVISALALTHKDTGDAGLGSESTAFGNFQPYANIGSLPEFTTGLTAANNVFAQYDDNHGICFYRGEDGDFVNGKTKLATHKLTVYIKRLPYRKSGLIDTINADTTYARKFTVETTMTMYCQPSFYFDETNKHLWVFSNLTSATTYDDDDVNYEVIDCNDTGGTAESIIQHGTIHSDAHDLAPVAMDVNWDGINVACPYYTNIIKDGNEIYFPTTSGSVNFGGGIFNQNGWKKINLSSGDQEAIPYKETQTLTASAMKTGGLIIGNGRVTNNGYGYTCQSFFPIYTQGQQMSWIINHPYDISTYAIAAGTSRQQQSRPRYILASKMINSTKYNLQNPITKDASKSLTVEYTLEEVAT